MHFSSPTSTRSEPPAQIADLSFTDLQSRLASVGDTLRKAEDEQAQLAAKLTTLAEKIKERERTLLILGGGVLPENDSPLVGLRSELEEARAKKSAMPSTLSLLKEARAALQREVTERQNYLEGQARVRCETKWKGKAPSHLEACRRVVAETALAHCRSRTSDPNFLDVNWFFETVVEPREVARLFREMVEEEMAEAKKHIVASDKRFGG